MYTIRILAVAALSLFAPPARAEAPLLWSYTPKKGLVDDCLAFDSQGTKLAFIHTDVSTFMDLLVVDTDQLKVATHLRLGAEDRTARRMVFTEDGKRIIIVFSVGASGSEVMLLSVETGKPVARLRRLSDARVVRYAGKQYVASVVDRRTGSGTQSIGVSLHDSQKLRTVKRARTALKPGGAVAHTDDLQLLYWGPGMTYLVGQRRGRYDAKRDIRLPDVVVQYDIFERRVVTERRPDNPMAWRKALQIRSQHPHQRRVLHVSDDLRSLELVDTDDAIKPVTLAVPWKLYEPRSLSQHESWDSTQLYFSLTIDPVNPDAVERKKADVERADIYRVSPEGQALLLGQVATGGRRFAWSVGDGRFVYLKKLKGFERGGRRLELRAIVRRKPRSTVLPGDPNRASPGHTKGAE